MTITDITARSGFGRNVAETTSDFATLFHNLILDVRDSYRPGLHPMRGPGPNWRPKHRPWRDFGGATPTR